MKLPINKVEAEQARKDLQPLLTVWLESLMQVDGFADWKNKDIITTITRGLGEDGDNDDGEDFPMPDHIVSEHKIVSGYIDLERACLDIRQCEYYFRRFPFHGLPVSHDDHLRNCCELYLNKVGQFRFRLEKQLKTLKRLKRGAVPSEEIVNAFRRQFASLLSERNAIHHEKTYDDLELKSVSLGNLLSIGNNGSPFVEFRKIAYRRNVKAWVKRIQEAHDAIEVYVGITAAVMIERCHFLNATPDKNIA